MALEISDIEDGDVDEVIALWQACELTRPWNDPGHDIGFARAQVNSDVLIGRVSGKSEIAASVMVGHDGHRGWVYYLAVRPDLQGGGFGREMMAVAEQWQKDRGIWKIQLMVRAGNEQVSKFYNGLDYRESGVKVLEKWFDPAKQNRH